MRRKRSKRAERLLFFIPVIVVVTLVVFAIVSYVSNESGTLVVEAMSSSRYSPSVMLHVPVAVDAFQGTTPVNLTLSSGAHDLTYGAIPWYRTPPSKAIIISGGKTEYAVTDYLPVLRVISFSGNGLNATSVTALHGVTPIVWVNHGSSVVTLEVDTVGRVTINPSQNYTLVLSSKGTFHFDIFNTQFSGVVQSA